MFTCSSTIKGKPPRLPFARIANYILGEKYSLGLVLCGSTLSRRLNETYRGKAKPANVLSFPLSDTEGEIFIDIRRARQEARHFDRNENDFIIFLFINGLLHLKGLAHSSKMEKLEKKIEKKFTPRPKKRR